MWNRIAPALAERFTVICPDLRGYGASGKPPSDDNHVAYSKRAMALDMVEVMRSLGHERFALAGHDRGARVAHRLALDHGDSVERLCLMDIVPGGTFYQTANMLTATAYWHWFFLIQPHPFPESVMARAPKMFIDGMLKRGWFVDEPGPPEVVAEYSRALRDPATIHAMCEDYRAGATIDLSHDATDLAAGKKVACPTLILWSAHGLVGRAFDPILVWSDWCADVRGQALDCGHFLPEERPEKVLASLIDFLQDTS